MDADGILHDCSDDIFLCMLMIYDDFTFNHIEIGNEHFDMILMSC